MSKNDGGNDDVGLIIVIIVVVLILAIVIIIIVIICYWKYRSMNVTVTVYSTCILLCIAIVIINISDLIAIYTVQAELLANITFGSLLKKRCWWDFELAFMSTVCRDHACSINGPIMV